MKKLSKLQINVNKILKDEELMYFKGGWEGTCEVVCPWGYFNGRAYGSNCQTAEFICEGMWTGCECYCC